MPSQKIDRILVPVDFSDTSRKAFYIALDYARIFDAETHVLHVKEPMTFFDSSFEKVEEVTEDLARLEAGVRRRVNELFDHGGLGEVDRRRVRIHIAGGKPHSEIVKHAINEKVDLIVMGTHGYSGVKAILIGSVTERVVRYAPCPVLCVKPDGYISPLEDAALREQL